MGEFLGNVWRAATVWHRPDIDLPLHHVEIDQATREALTPRDLLAIDDFYKDSPQDGRIYRIESTD